MPHAARSCQVKCVIVPLPNGSNGQLGPNESLVAAPKLTFLETFGRLGIPMVVVIIVAIMWTCWLIMLTVAPNETANLLMDTADFDNGLFWLIIDPEPVLMWFSVCGLGLVAFGYVFVLARMTILRKTHVNISNRPVKDHVPATQPTQASRGVRLLAIWTDLTGFHGKHRKFWNVYLKVLDLVMQAIMIMQALETGSPQSLVYGCAGLVAANAIVYSIGILTPRHHSAFAEILIDSVFDLSVTVIFPIVVLLYCYTNFRFDRNAILLNMEVLPPGSPEAHARAMADPVETELFRVTFDSIRTQTVVSFLLRISMNISFCYRCKRIVEILIEASVKKRLNSDPRDTALVIVHQRPVPRTIALLFQAFAVLLLISVDKMVQSSTSACAAYPECVVFAYRWTSAANASCPCIALIDVNQAPTVYDEWINAPDATEKVKELSIAGDLRVFQLVNRRLLALPEELKQSKNLQHMLLLYTETTIIPEWFKMFHKLEYLRFGGKSGFTNLRTLPEDLFASMNSLTFLHIGSHRQLKALPSFQGLKNLKSLTLAVLPSIPSVPSFDPLGYLRILDIVAIASVPAWPDMAPLKHLVNFSLGSRNIVCCNGFLDGVCDLTHSDCIPDTNFGLPAATCLNASQPHATEATFRAFQKYSAAVCQTDSPNVEPVLKANVEICGGVQWRQCAPSTAANGTQGICANIRMQVLFCSADQSVIQLRREQIRRGIGGACDPNVEAWLGCNG